MDNHEPEPPEQGSETIPEEHLESPAESQASSEAGSQGYVNENITRAFEKVNKKFAQAKDHYNQSPHLQKIVYQGKFKPAFWTVTAIFSLLINSIFIAILILFGRYFFEVKALVADNLVKELSTNLALMDKAHIVTPVRVETTVELSDNLPVVFDLPINQSTQLSLSENTQISGATIYLNNTPVLTDLTIPAGTPIQANLDMTIPVSQSVPVNVSVPVSLMVPLDIPIDQTDLHQSIVGLQGAIEPYQALASEFNSNEDFPLCNYWWSGWLCSIFLGKP